MRLSIVYVIIKLVACACAAILKCQLFFNTVNAIEECNEKLGFSAKVFVTATGHTLVQFSIDGIYNLTDGQMDEFIECVKSQGGIATMSFFREDVHECADAIGVTILEGGEALAILDGLDEDIAWSLDEIEDVRPPKIEVELFENQYN